MFALILLFDYLGALPNEKPISSVCSVPSSCWKESNQMAWCCWWSLLIVSIYTARLKDCSDMNICILSKFLCWNLNPQGDVSPGESFGWWLRHEDGALMNGIGALTEEASESSLTPSAMWEHSKKVSTRKQAFTRTQPCRHLGLGLAASRNVRKYIFVM